MPKELRTISIPADVAPGTEVVVFKAEEVVETGVSSLIISWTALRNLRYTPAGQRAKWFRDELDQLWVKFDEAPSNQSQRVVTHVIPASRVVDVQYEK